MNDVNLPDKSASNTPVRDLGGMIPARPGASLKEYCEYIGSGGRSCALTCDGSQAWIPNQAYTLSRLPLECCAQPEKSALRQVLRQRGVWVASFQMHPTEEYPANCFYYVCRNSHYAAEGLDYRARRDVRRGLRSFEIRRISAEELAEHGYAAVADTDGRHGYAPPSLDAFRRRVLSASSLRFHERWGAWEGGTLAALVEVIKIDNWALIMTNISTNASLRNCPNNALCHQVTRQMLIVENRDYISYGMSSLEVGARELSLHKYKTRMGYEAIPLYRCFHFSPLVSPIVSGPFARWVWGRLASVRPESRTIGKVAGLTHLLRPRTTGWLDWANAQEGNEQS